MIQSADTTRTMRTSEASRNAASRPSFRAPRNVTTASAESPRESTGQSARTNVSAFASGASCQRPKASSRYAPQAITANAPARGSFMISSFFSRGACDERASATSQKPSRWMPPVTAIGRTVKSAAASVRENESASERAIRPNINRPITPPIAGKKHIAYAMFSSRHSTCGAGSLEYIVSAMQNERQSFITIPFLSKQQGCRIRPPQQHPQSPQACGSPC